DDSRDLDQLTVGERLPNAVLRLQVAIADVDALVVQGSAVDRHAACNTTSIYTAGGVFPMLPERLSTDLTSLNPECDRLALVVTMDIDGGGSIGATDIRRARVRNHAKLAYPSIGAWLEGTPAPTALARVPGLEDQLRLQDEATTRLRERRQDLGALDLDTGEARAVVRDGKVVDLLPTERNRAMELIADAMIATNGVVARFLAQHRLPSIRRVVRRPDRWDRIVELARGLGSRLPAEPDGRALEAFLRERRSADPLHFPDLSLSVVKLIGKGEYVLELPGKGTGHFGLAVRDYAHSTAPNRRYPDLITHRLVKAALAGHPMPYSDEDLAGIAAHCTEQEDNATKVERRMRKSAAALFLRPRIGESFDAVVTGASEKGTWVRTLRPAVEGKVMRGDEGLDVGDRVRVRLMSVDVERGFIDFSAAR
ncbi:MAG: RNB domain-containing ribonuclease, partial [Planctomycetes bacterium]|nr:RNB domain-containing ribonuclease [Planctomycetota bacterium]